MFRRRRTGAPFPFQKSLQKVSKIFLSGPQEVPPKAALRPQVAPEFQKCLNWRPRAPRSRPQSRPCVPNAAPERQNLYTGRPRAAPKSTIFCPFAKLPLRSLCDSNAAPESQKPFKWPPTADPQSGLAPPMFPGRRTGVPFPSREPPMRPYRRTKASQSS